MNRPLIQLKIRNVHQLFNSMDPSPFRERDLDHDAEEFIESSALEYPPATPLKLSVQLEEAPETDPTDLIRDAVHNYFAYQARLNRLEFSRLMKQGRTSLVIGLVFLVLCLSAVRMLPVGGSWIGVLRESLTIGGWVAMWRPMEIFLYDWWPLRRKGRVYVTLSEMPVEVAHRESR